jgi:hypothetical protein
MRRWCPNLKFLYLTSEGAGPGFEGTINQIAFLKKPFTLGSMIQRVKELIG